MLKIFNSWSDAPSDHELLPQKHGIILAKVILPADFADGAEKN
jgi:hypothetical protein